MKTVTQILHSIPQVLRANEYPWCVFTTALPKSIRFFCSFLLKTHFLLPYFEIFFFQFLMIRISVEGTWIFLPQGCWLVHGKGWTSGLKIKWFAPFRLGSFRRRRLSFERGAIFFNSIYSVQLIWKYIVAGPSPATSNSIVLCLFTRFMSIPVVCVNGKHTWILGIFALCKRRVRQCKFGVVVIWLYSSRQWHFFSSEY